MKHPNRGTDYFSERLAREFPELNARVEAGELSPYAAAVRAGIRRRMIGIPKDSVEMAGALLAKHFAKDLDALLAAITRAAADRGAR